MTATDLDDLDDCLKGFHECKSAISDAGLLGKRGWNGIAKLHMLSHYTSSIRRHGVPDGFSTETPEYLHIEYAKIPWRKSGRKQNAIDEFYGPEQPLGRRTDALEDNTSEEWVDVEEESAGETRGDSGCGYFDSLLHLVAKPTDRKSVV